MNELLSQGFELHKNGMFLEAEQVYNQVLRQDSKNISALNYLARLKLDLKDFILSIKFNEQVLKIDPKFEDALFELALAYKNIGDFETSIEYYKKVIEYYPQVIQAYYNIASIYADMGKMNEAIYYFDKVLQFNGDDTETKYFISIAYMKNREYKKGLPFFENRLCRKSAVLTQEHTYPNLMLNAKLWQGEEVLDKTIYTYYEAGFGDVLMFARYLPLLQKKCKKIIFKPQVPLVELFEENFPEIDVMRYFYPENKIHFDYHIPMLSLPYALGLDEESMFVYKDNYLSANLQKVEKYKSKYFDNTSFKIGFKWQGNTRYDWERVIDVKEFIKLFQVPHTKFYSFQTFDGSEELEKLQQYAEIVDIGKTLSNFSDTAAAIENVDLIICNDTSLAHIAGAMGKPCWVLLPYLYNWRWHQDLSKCDWYDSVKVFRQTNPGNWDSVFDSLYKELIVTMTK